MITLTRFLITIPVILLTPLAAGLRPALAEGAPAQQAVEILARAKAADNHCHVLSAAERDELGRYSARAEIAAASQVSVEAAQSARQRGETAGVSSGCSSVTEADIRETLVAAREAVAAGGSGNSRQRTRRIEPVSAAPQKSANDLARYGHLVEAYYLERQCRSLPKPQADRFWRAIVQLHRATVARNGARTVAPVMNRAERQARDSRCGSATLARIQDGYAEIRTR